MGLTNDLATAVKTKMASVTGIRSTYARLPDSIAAAPAAILGSPRIDVEAGSFERITYTFPLRLYVERTADDDRTAQTLYDLVDATVAAFRTGNFLDGTSTGPALVVNIDTNGYDTVAGADYFVAECELAVYQHSPQTYSPS